MSFKSMVKGHELAYVTKILAIFGAVEERQMQRLFSFLSDSEYGKIMTLLAREGQFYRTPDARYEAISSELFAIAHTIEDTPRHNPHNKIYSLIRTAETNTVTLRNLGARTQWSNIAPFYEDLATVLGISVKEYEKWITITVPAILPNRNRRDNLAFITRPLRSSLVKFQREHPLERFRDCVVCIVHQYDEAMSLRRVRDYDNIETKRYLDVIESVMLTNDNGLLLTVLQTTELGDRDCTEFYLMSPDKLSSWAAEHIKAHT